MTRFHDLFSAPKPIIAMAHVPPLPGTPLYDADRGVDGLVEAVRVDLRILLDGGVDAVMFCNEGDRPYSLEAGYDGVSVMTRVVTELRPTDPSGSTSFGTHERPSPWALPPAQVSCERSLAACTSLTWASGTPTRRHCFESVDGSTRTSPSS